MTLTCQTCQAEVEEGDRFCQSCGTRLQHLVNPAAAIQSGHQSTEVADVTDDIHPLIAVQPTEAPRRRPRRRWYRRKVFMVPLLLLLIALIATAGTVAYVSSQFSDVNALSTPPAELSSDRLGGKEQVVIDTGPAQEAVRDAEQNGDAVATDGDNDGNVASARGDTANPARTPTAGEVGTNSSEPASTDALDAALRPTSDGSVTILLMGVDARPGEPIDIEVRPDTLAVLHLESDTGSCRLLSIPRDTRTELPGYGLTKVNHALAVGGIPYQALVTQQLLGLEIDHYGLIDFAGIEGLVDAVGGVTVVNDAAFTQSGFSFDAGEIHLNGEEALHYSRFRQDNRGDFGRIDRQQQVVRALISQTSGMDVVSGAYQLLGAVEGHVKTDMSVTDLIGLANDFRSSCTEATLEVETLDGTVASFPDPLLNMELSYVVVEESEIEQKVDWLLGGE